MAEVSINKQRRLATDTELPEAYKRLFASVNRSKKHMPTMSQLRLIKTKMAHDIGKINGSPDPQLVEEYEIVTEALKLFDDNILTCEGRAERLSMTGNSKKYNKHKKTLEDDDVQKIAMEELMVSNSCAHVQKKLQIFSAMSAYEKEHWIQTSQVTKKNRISKPVKRSLL